MDVNTIKEIRKSLRISLFLTWFSFNYLSALEVCIRFQVQFGICAWLNINKGLAYFQIAQYPLIRKYTDMQDYWCITPNNTTVKKLLRDSLRIRYLILSHELKLLKYGDTQKIIKRAYKIQILLNTIRTIANNNGKN